MKRRRRTRRFRSYINFFYFRFSIVLRNYRLELIIEFNEGNKKKKKRRRRRRRRRARKTESVETIDGIVPCQRN